jgi:hypothetical protein
MPIFAESFARPAIIGGPDWGVIAERVVQHCDVHISLERFALWKICINAKIFRTLCAWWIRRAVLL